MIIETKTHIATISILVKERETHATEVNEILTRHGDHILARLGVNLGRAGIRTYSALIEIVFDGTSEEIRSFTTELDALYGIVAKTNILD